MLEERVTKIELHVEQLQQDVAEIKADQREMRKDLNGLRGEFHSFRVEVTREFGNMGTAIEQSKRWMIVAAAGMFATGIGALAATARVMKWF